MTNLITLRLLILEDEPNDAELEIAELEAAGYECAWERVDTREDFLDRLGSEEYDLILSDYALPSFDGLTALKLLRERAPHIPFILVSGTLGEDAAIESLLSGAADYVLKGRLSRLAPVVRRALKEKKDQLDRQRAEELVVDLARFPEENNSPVIRISDRGVLIYANPASAALLSDAERVPGTPVSEPWQRVVRDALAAGVAGETEVRINQRVFSVNTSPVAERGYVNLYASDITERSEYEEKLKRLSIAVEQSPEAIVITDPSGTIQYVNPAFEAVTGYSLQEVTGKTPRIIYGGKHDAAFYKALWNAISSGRVWNGRFINKRKDGTLFTEEASIAPVKDAQGAITNYVAVKRDISVELIREEEFRQSQKMEAIGLLAGGVAHDFNNILQGILGYSELLSDDLVEGSRECQYAVAITNAALKASEVTRQLLVFGRKHEVDSKLCSLNDSIRDSMALIGILLGEKYQVTLGLEECLPEIDGNTGQLSQIIMNMVVNARDSMPCGGQISISTQSVTLSERDVKVMPDARQGCFVCLSIADAGCGIDPDSMPHLFEPFFTTKEVGKGTGLGLSVVYGIMKQSKGWVSVCSEKGHGSEFKLYFPVSDKNKIEHGEPEAESNRTMDILLAENDLALRSLIDDILKTTRCNVVAVGSMAEAVEYFDKDPDRYALLLSDTSLPDGSGIDLADRLRHTHAKLPVLLCGGHAGQMEQWRQLKSRDYHFVSKPFTVMGLVRSIQDLLPGSIV
jgi:PAS domain S-box-containing protein